MLERPAGGESAILVHIDFSTRKMQEDLSEFQELAKAAGAKAIVTITGTREVPEPKYFVGTGKAEEIRAAVVATKAKLVLFNHTLSPGQERNLEQLLKCRVLDRTGLILDIFAQRARSFEGKLQVELALLKHHATRLVRGWTHLERQKGGIGLRGPGETQLESDRRMIRERIKVINKRLQKLDKQRELGRRARRRAAIPTVALVGYTNAGKSTLFNRLCGASAFVADMLFATLDPTFRRLEIPGIGAVILADTVGFIRHLPHDLIEAFHGTLEEVCEADLLLHVVDAHDESRQANIEQVLAVLEEIKASSVPQVLVFNKLDLCEREESGVERGLHADVRRVWVSALTGAGMDDLIAVIAELLGKEIIKREIVLQPNQGELRARLYRQGAVLSEETDAEGNHLLLVQLPLAEFEKIFLEKS